MQTCKNEMFRNAMQMEGLAVANRKAGTAGKSEASAHRGGSGGKSKARRISPHGLIRGGKRCDS